MTIPSHKRIAADLEQQEDGDYVDWDQKQRPGELMIEEVIEGKGTGVNPPGLGNHLHLVGTCRISNVPLF